MTGTVSNARPPQKTHSDRTNVGLVARLKRNDVRAQQQLVSDNSEWMLRLAESYLRSREDAEDAVQDAFVCIFSSIHKFENRCALKTWIYRITANAALMRMRRAYRRREVSVDPQAEEAIETFGCNDVLTSTTALPFDLLVSKQRAQHVEQAVASLPNQYEQIVRLRDLAEHTTADVAVLLDMSETNVKVRLHRARGALKKLLVSSELASTA